MRDFSDEYRSLLVGKFAGINLTKILTKQEFYHKQILDSILPLQHSLEFTQFLEKTGILLDVGFGAGFPLLPLAHSLPEMVCCGIEAKAKKVRVVRQIANHFALENLYLSHTRLEELFIDVSLGITFKAVGDVTDCLKKIRTDQRVRAFFYKGPRFNQLEDISTLPAGWKLIKEYRLPLSGSEGRIFLIFENTRDVGREMGKSRKFTEIFGNVEKLG